ncbi:HoxN/HupN/NixA family nickel/cobalt transporter [Georgenia subflava]|uniref:Nickel/cobalt efflux system n=1 Tax=Georgenia subflava TaxID=1622177 RepID=A0A6N7EI32_9MICO|nr:HoxN/HupN/NixA family nickel/cobalt transporter [Georgenia subflava]
MRESGRPTVSVGFWFALGHSTVVVAAVGLLAAGVNTLAAQISADDSVLASVTSVWGPLVSGGFLILIGTVNLVSLVGIWRVFRRLSTGEYDQDQLDEQLHQRGVLARALRPVTRHIDRPWKMYPVGLLFGLGFDTATTIGLFVIGSGAAVSAPWYVVLVLPVLFTAGMTLFDTLDGIVMSRAYRWAFARPVRRVYYNLTVTAMSVGVAFLVAAVTLAGLLTADTRASAAPVAWLAELDLENFGLVIVGLLLLTWLGAVAFWKVGGIEARYSGEA